MRKEGKQLVKNKRKEAESRKQTVERVLKWKKNESNVAFVVVVKKTYSRGERNTVQSSRVQDGTGKQGRTTVLRYGLKLVPGKIIV